MPNGESFNDSTVSLAQYESTISNDENSITYTAPMTPENTVTIADYTESLSLASKEISDPIAVDSFKEAAPIIEKAFTDYLEVRYAKFPYHNIEHALQVRTSALELFDTLATTHEGRTELMKAHMNEPITADLEKKAEDPKEIEKLRIYLNAISLGHDIIQVATVSSKTGMLERSRGMDKGASEGETAQFINDYLQRFIDKDGKKLFADFDLDRISKDIDSTTVSFSVKETSSPYVPYGEKILYIDTPSITPESSVIDVLLATADLKMASGGENTMQHFDSSNKEFRELNPWFNASLEKGVADVSLEERVRMGTAVLNWVNTQRGFLVAQEQIFDKFLDTIKSPHVKEILEAKVNHTNFERNIRSTDIRSEYLNQSYKLTIMEAQIQLLQEQSPAAGTKEYQELQDLMVQRTRLAGDKNYIKPGARSHGALVGSDNMNLDKAILALAAEVGYKVG